MENIKDYLLNLKEDPRVEFKLSERKVPSSFYESYSSFANTEGGTIYLGIKEGRINEIVGVENPEEQLKAILSTLENKEKVSKNVLSSSDYEIIDIEGKKIIVVRVKEADSHDKPIHLNGSLFNSYKRVGEGDKKMSEEEIQNRVIEKGNIKHDSLINSFGFGIDSLDQGTLRSYREAFASFHPDSEMNHLSDLEFLTRIGAYIKDEGGKGGLTNGAVLFFGKWENIIRIYPGYFLDYRYYDRGYSERWSKRFYSDDFSFPGNAYSFYLKVREEAATHLPNPFKRSKDGDTNLDGRDILEAVMEVVVNALSNAAYTLSYGVKIIQTPNSFKTINPGDIPVGEKQAISGGVSLPRNPGILLFFRAIGKAERSGFGVPKIYDVSRRYGYPAPSLSIRKDLEMTEMHISFLSLPYDAPSREAKLRIITFLANRKEGASAKEIMDELSFSRSTAALLVRELLSSGILITNGKEKKGRRIYLAEGAGNLD